MTFDSDSSSAIIRGDNDVPALHSGPEYVIVKPPGRYAAYRTCFCILMCLFIFVVALSIVSLYFIIGRLWQNDFAVLGKSTFNGLTVVHHVQLTSATVDALATFANGFTAYGPFAVVRDLSVSGTLVAKSAISTSSNLVVDGSLSLTMGSLISRGTIVVAGEMNITNTVQLAGLLRSASSSVLSASSVTVRPMNVVELGSDVLVGDAVIPSTLSILGNLSTLSPLDVRDINCSTASFSGNAVLLPGVGVSRLSMLSVGLSSTMNGNQLVGIGSLLIGANASLRGSLFSQASVVINDNGIVWNNVSVLKSFSSGTDVKVGMDAVVSGSVACTSSLVSLNIFGRAGLLRGGAAVNKSMLVKGQVASTGWSSFGALLLTDAVTVGGSIAVSSAVVSQTLSGPSLATVAVVEDIHINGSVLTNKSVNVASGSVVRGSANFSTSNIGASLTSLGSLSLYSELSVGGFLSVDSGFILNGSLSVKNTTTVAGAVAWAAPYSVYDVGSMTVAGRVDISGAASVSRGMTVGKDLNASQFMDVAGELAVGQDIFVLGDARVNDSIFLYNGSVVRDCSSTAMWISNDARILVTGDMIFLQDVRAQRWLSPDANVSLVGNVTFWNSQVGAALLTGVLNATEGLVISSNLTSYGFAVRNHTLLSMTSVFAGGLAVRRNSVLNDDVSVNNQTHVGGPTVTVLRGASFDASLIIAGNVTVHSLADAVIRGNFASLTATVQANWVFARSMSIIGTLSVLSPSVFTSWLSLSNSVALIGNLSCASRLSVVGGNFSVSGGSIAIATLLSSRESVTVKRSFASVGLASIGEDVSISGSLLGVDDVFVSGSLFVGGSQSSRVIVCNESLRVGSGTNISRQVTVHGRVDIDGSFFSRAFSGAHVHIAGNTSLYKMQVGGRLEDSLSLDVRGTSTLAGHFVTTGSSLAVGGDGATSDGLVIGECMLVSNRSSFGGAGDFNGTLRVGNVMFVNGPMMLGRDLSVNGLSTFGPSSVFTAAKQIVVGRNLTVHGPFQTFVTLDLGLDAEFQSSVSFTAGLTVRGNVRAGYASILGDLYAFSNFTVLGNVSLHNTIFADGASLRLASAMIRFDSFNYTRDAFWIVSSDPANVSNRYIGFEKVKGAPSSSYVHLRPANSSALFIRSNGRVGLGTAEPPLNSSLQVIGDIALGVDNRLLLSASCIDSFVASSCLSIVPESQPVPAAFRMERGLHLDSAGNLGIHSLAPSERAVVNATDARVIGDVSLAHGGTVELRQTRGTIWHWNSYEGPTPPGWTVQGFRFRYDDSILPTHFIDVTGPLSPLRKIRLSSSVTPSLISTLIVDPSGRISLGGSDPSSSLELHLPTYFRSNVVLHTDMRFSGVYGRTLMHVFVGKAPVPDNVGFRLRFDDKFDSPTSEAMLFELTAGSGSAPTNSLTFRMTNASSSSDVLCVKGNGQIGVNTILPTNGRMLDVNGDMLVRGYLYAHGKISFNLYGSTDHVLFNFRNQEDMRLRYRDSSLFAGIAASEDVLVFEKQDMNSGNGYADGLFAFFTDFGGSLVKSLIFLGDGNVGVQTVPAQRLHIGGSVYLRDDVRLTSFVLSLSPAIIFDFNSDHVSSKTFRFLLRGSTYQFLVDNVFNAPIQFSTGAAGKSLTTMYVHNNNRVSIGSAADYGDMMYVNGDVQFDGVLTMIGEVFFNNDVNDYLDGRMSGGNGHGMVIAYDSGNNVAALTKYETNTGLDTDVSLMVDSTSTAGVCFRRTSSGVPVNVGINTDYPSSLYALHVSGVARFDGDVTVSGILYTSQTVAPHTAGPTGSKGFDMGSFFASALMRPFYVVTGCARPNYYQYSCCMSYSYDWLGNLQCDWWGWCDAVTYYTDCPSRIFDNGAGSVASGVSFTSLSFSFSVAFSAYPWCKAMVHKTSSVGEAVITGLSTTGITLALGSSGGVIDWRNDNDPYLSFICYGYL